MVFRLVGILIRILVTSWRGTKVARSFIKSNVKMYVNTGFPFLLTARCGIVKTKNCFGGAREFSDVCIKRRPYFCSIRSDTKSDFFSSSFAHTCCPVYKCGVVACVSRKHMTASSQTDRAFERFSMLLKYCLEVSGVKCNDLAENQEFQLIFELC